MTEQKWETAPDMSVLLPPEWVKDASCADEDPETFYVETGDTQKAMRARIICMNCPVARECLSFALETGQEFGIWGGATKLDRVHIRKAIRQKPKHREAIVAAYVKQLRPRVAAWRKRKKKNAA